VTLYPRIAALFFGSRLSQIQQRSAILDGVSLCGIASVGNFF